MNAIWLRRGVALTVLAGAGALWVPGWVSSPVATFASVTSSSTAVHVVSSTKTAPVAAARTRALVHPRAPLRLDIAALGLSVPVGRVGLNPDGTVGVPASRSAVGWFDLGPTPGQIGSAVMLGHVDSYQGVGVFFYLKDLRAGDLVRVSLSGGLRATFTVTRVVLYAKAAFPAQAVYGNHGRAQLQLVTCGGTFDPRSGYYANNLVVYSTLIALTH